MRLTQAQTAAVKALEDKHGRIQPARLVQAARDKRSPLHGLFNWDLKQAAERWWRHRARLIIGSVLNQVQTTERTYNVTGYVRDMSAKGQGYRSVVALRDDPASARESLVYTLETAAGHLRRAFDLATPLGLSGEIDRLLEQIAGVQRIVRKKAA